VGGGVVVWRGWGGGLIGVGVDTQVSRIYEFIPRWECLIGGWCSRVAERQRGWGVVSGLGPEGPSTTPRTCDVQGIAAVMS
jgi:hypothetical protein